MCDFCSEFYHPECIGLNESASLLQSLSIFKCPICICTGKRSPLYQEGAQFYNIINSHTILIK